VNTKPEQYERTLSLLKPEKIKTKSALSLNGKTSPTVENVYKPSF